MSKRLHIKTLLKNRRNYDKAKDEYEDAREEYYSSAQDYGKYCYLTNLAYSSYIEVHAGTFRQMIKVAKQKVTKSKIIIDGESLETNGSMAIWKDHVRIEFPLTDDSPGLSWSSERNGFPLTDSNWFEFLFRLLSMRFFIHEPN